MKVVLASLAVLAAICFISCSSSESSETSTTDSSGINWVTDIQKAEAQAASQQKPIFAYFTGSDWCGWCKRLDANILSHKEFQDYARDNLVMLKLDFPRRTPQPPEVAKVNKSLAQRYGVRGFPTIVLTDAQGKEIARTGFQYMSAAEYVEHLKSLLKSS